jgi:hypothetical protein
VGWITDFLLGSEGEIDWDELAKMVNLQSDINKTDRSGVFTGYEWERDENGKAGNRQVQTINPAFQGAVDRLGFNAGKSEDPYTSPSQFDQMLDAKMNNQMNRQGLDTSGYRQNGAPWQTSAESGANARPGTAGNMDNAWLPPPPGSDPVFEVQDPLAPAFDAPPPEPEPGAGLPDDYYNDKGNVRRKYRDDNKWYVGDEELRRWEDDPEYGGVSPGDGLPTDYYNDKGKVRRRYRDQQYYQQEPGEGGDAVYGTGTGAPDDWLNKKGNIRRRYQGLSPEEIDAQPDDYYNDKGNVRRKYRGG